MLEDGAWDFSTLSIQRILKQRARAGQHPTATDEIIAWLEAVAQAWNRDLAPFERGGKRAGRRAWCQDRRRILSPWSAAPSSSAR